MSVGDREFGALLERVDGLAEALHDALPALQRRDTCQLTYGALERRIAAMEERSARLWPRMIGATGVLVSIAALVVSIAR
jgi:hypothetical protein